MNVFYARVSSLDQKLDRQRITGRNYDKIVEDKCSGAIGFFDRPEGSKIRQLAEKGKVTSLSVLSVDRLGRNTLDILQTIKFFSDRKICVEVVGQGIKTLNEDGSENSIGKMILGIMGTLAEMERNQIRERQQQGIELAKSRGVYKGRKAGSKESALDFLSKPKNKEALGMLKRGLKATEIVQLTGLDKNTLSKIRKVAKI